MEGLEGEGRQGEEGAGKKRREGSGRKRTPLISGSKHSVLKYTVLGPTDERYPPGSITVNPTLPKQVIACVQLSVWAENSCPGLFGHPL